MANGQDKESVEKLSHKELQYIYYAFKLGLAGPYKDYIIAYNLNPPYNKDGKLIPFIEVFKQVNDCMELKEDSRKQSQSEMALAAAASLGMPKHMLDKMKGV